MAQTAAPFHLVARAGLARYCKSEPLIEPGSSLASEDAQADGLPGRGGFRQQVLHQRRSDATATVWRQQGNIHQEKLLLGAVDDDVSNGLITQQDDGELRARKGGAIALQPGVKLHTEKGLPRRGGQARASNSSCRVLA